MSVPYDLHRRSLDEAREREMAQVRRAAYGKAAIESAVFYLDYNRIDEAKRALARGLAKMEENA